MGIFVYEKVPIHSIEGNKIKLFYKDLSSKDGYRSETNLKTGIDQIITFKGSVNYYKCESEEWNTDYTYGEVGEICVEFSDDFSGLILFEDSYGIEIYYKNCFIGNYYDDTGKFIENLYVFSDNEEELDNYIRSKEGFKLTEENKKLYEKIQFILENTEKEFGGYNSENYNGCIETTKKFILYDKKTKKKVGYLEEYIASGDGTKE